jgi:hypothetical protein
LKSADIVCTNPPFSLFRAFVAQLKEHGKKFIIIGNNNAVGCKEIFKLIKENQIWLGVSPRSMEFKLHDGTLKSVNACWFTNLTHNKRNEELYLVAEYSSEDYQKYDNFDAIEVSKVKNLPKKYDGMMGVPITFLDKYNPEQFEIIGLIADKRDPDEIFIKGTPVYLDDNHKKYVGSVLNGKATYSRIIIKHKK